MSITRQTRLGESLAALISTSDRIIEIGVADGNLLLYAAGLQIRKLIEIQPDARC
jgi:hypothetical protein